MTKEELQAMRAVIQEELGPVNQRLDRLQKDVDLLKKDSSQMKEDIEQIKEDSEITRVAVNALGEWAENIAVITAVTYPVKKAR